MDSQRKFSIVHITLGCAESEAIPHEPLVSAIYGNDAGSVKTQSRFLTGVWHDVQTCIPFSKDFCSKPTHRAQPQLYVSEYFFESLNINSA